MILGTPLLFFCTTTLFSFCGKASADLTGFIFSAALASLAAGFTGLAGAGLAPQVWQIW